MSAYRELRLTNVPEPVYLTLLEYKAKQEQRLKRVCTFTDALTLMHLESKALRNIEDHFQTNDSIMWEKVAEKIEKMEEILRQSNV